MDTHSLCRAVRRGLRSYNPPTLSCYPPVNGFELNRLFLNEYARDRECKIIDRR